MADNRFTRLEFDNQPSGLHRRGFAAPEKTADDYLARADHLARQGDFENALRCYSQALGENPLTVEAWTGQVRMLISLEEHPEAAVWADKAMEKFPDNPVLLALKAVASLRMGSRIQARAICDAAIRQKGDLEFVWLCRGEIFLLENRTTAESCFVKALVASKNKGWTQMRIGEIYLRDRKYVLAVKALIRATELEPGFACAWYLLGKAQQALGMTHPAHVSFQQAAELAPRNSLYREALAFRPTLRSRLSGTFRRILSK